MSEVYYVFLLPKRALLPRAKSPRIVAQLIMSFIDREKQRAIDSGRLFNLGRRANQLFQGAASPLAFKKGMGVFDSQNYAKYVANNGLKDTLLSGAGLAGSVPAAVIAHFTPLLPVALAVDIVFAAYTAKKFGDAAYDTVQLLRTVTGPRTPRTVR